MPKVIENLRSRLIGEAQKQVREAGYSAMTIRSVAKACGVGTGTVYNYFPSKDALLAAGMLEAWNGCMERINAAADANELFRGIYDELRAYAAENGALFHDSAAAASYAGAFSRYHAVLRAQLAAPVRKICRDDFTAEFIAEAMLTWTMAGKEYEMIYSVIEKLL